MLTCFSLHCYCLITTLVRERASFFFIDVSVDSVRESAASLAPNARHTVGQQPGAFGSASSDYARNFRGGTSSTTTPTTNSKACPRACRCQQTKEFPAWTSWWRRQALWEHLWKRCAVSCTGSLWVLDHVEGWKLQLWHNAQCNKIPSFSNMTVRFARFFVCCLFNNVRQSCHWISSLRLVNVCQYTVVWVVLRLEYIRGSFVGLTDQ